MVESSYPKEIRVGDEVEVELEGWFYRGQVKAKVKHGQLYRYNVHFLKQCSWNKVSRLYVFFFDVDLCGKQQVWENNFRTFIFMGDMGDRWFFSYHARNPVLIIFLVVSARNKCSILYLGAIHWRPATSLRPARLCNTTSGQTWSCSLQGATGVSQLKERKFRKGAWRPDGGGWRKWSNVPPNILQRDRLLDILPKNYFNWSHTVSNLD